MSLLKWFIAISTVIISFVSLLTLFVVTVENRQARKNRALLAKAENSKELNNIRRTAVIVYSRSGNTAVIGKHFADRFDADLFRLESPEYMLGARGWINALLDAREKEAVITPDTLNMSQYDTVFLGSPIWLYSPAPPIWQFAKNNRFDGQKVILFNTFNSQFKPEYIQNFQSLIAQNGSNNFKHIYVQRGRMGQQISIEDMIRKFDLQLDQHGEP